MKKSFQPGEADQPMEALLGYLCSGNTEEELRIAAAEALGLAGGDQALQGLMSFLKAHSNAPERVKAAAILAIGVLLGKQ